MKAEPKPSPRSITPAIPAAEAGELPTLKITWATEGIQRQPGQLSKTIFEKVKQGWQYDRMEHASLESCVPKKHARLHSPPHPQW